MSCEHVWGQMNSGPIICQRCQALYTSRPEPEWRPVLAKKCEECGGKPMVSNGFHMNSPCPACHGLGILLRIEGDT